MLPEKLKVIHLASEMAPYAKTGGLADVVAELPRALSGLGNVDCYTVTPKYGFIDETNMKEMPFDVYFTMTGISYSVKIKYIEFNGSLSSFFIESKDILGRDNMYGYADDGYRFAFFSRAVLEMAKALNFKPDVIHCHDWHTAMVPVYLKTIYRDDPFFKDTATVFTIHNLGYQGIFSKELLPFLDISWDEFKVEKLEYWDNINFIKAGISYSDIVSTVSRQYSKEIQTPDYGETLDRLLSQRKDFLFGIVNGIDYDIWNPATDKALVCNYDETSIEDKVKNKLALQKEMGLPEDHNKIVAGVVSRLSYQKGLDIIINSAYDIANLGIQLVVLGTGEEFYQNMFRRIAYELPDNVSVMLEFNDPLARRIYAGSDIFLMPSRYEPCGLSQIIAMRYGTVPVVRRTGGLVDTVIDYYDQNSNSPTGFCFDEASSYGMMSAIRNAVNIYYEKDNWKKLILNCLRADFSWKHSAREYLELYKKAIEIHRSL